MLTVIGYVAGAAAITVIIGFTVVLAVGIGIGIKNSLKSNQPCEKLSK